MDNTKEFRCISLCSGYAGIELGLERVIPNLRTVCYVEVEAFACTNLVAKIEQGKLVKAPIWTDIKTFDGRPFRDRVHLIAGGYPCQPYSCTGQKKGTDDPRHLFPYIERIIEAVRALWVFLENVSGHLTIGFPEVYRSLRNLGYSVEAGLFTASECGAPHKRQRLFILAYNGSWGCRIRPNKTKSKTMRGQTRITKSGSSLAHSCNGTDGQNPRRNEEKEGVQGIDRKTLCGRGIAGTGEQLAYGNEQGLEGGEATGNAEVQGQEHDKLPARYDRWPSRPGQPQYFWEEPRVVAYSKGTGLKARGTKRVGKGADNRASGETPCQGEGKIERQLGRATPRSASGVDPVANRVDRLRLLGNGVVPQCAELAFRTLIKKFPKDM